MRIVSWLAAAGLVMSTAGCVETTGYPTTYGYSPGYNTGYGNTGYGNAGYGNTGYGNTGYGYQGYSNNTYSQPNVYRAQQNYYAPQVVTQTRYVPVPVPVSQPRSRSWGMRDSDGDGVPDRYQRRQF